MPSKITRLSPIELANNAALPSALKRQHLESIETPKVFWNVDPIRSNFASVMRADPALPLDLSAGSDEALIAKILGDCGKSEEQRNACEAIARAMIEFRNKSNLCAAVPDESVTPYRLTTDTIYFAENILLKIDGVVYLVALDLRATSGLTKIGREVVNSAIFSRSKLGSFRNTKVAVLRTPSIRKGARKAILEVQPSEPMFSADRLDAMFAETYAIWELMLMARRSADKDGSSFSEGLFERRPD